MDTIYKLLGMRHPNDWPNWISWLPLVGFMLMLLTLLLLARKKTSNAYQFVHWYFLIGVLAFLLTMACAAYFDFEVEEVSSWLHPLILFLPLASRFIYFRFVAKAKKGVGWIPKW